MSSTTMTTVATVAPIATVATVAPVASIASGNDQTIAALIDAIQALTAQDAVNSKKLDDLINTGIHEREAMIAEINRIKEKTACEVFQVHKDVKQIIDDAGRLAHKAIDDADRLACKAIDDGSKAREIAREEVRSELDRAYKDCELANEALNRDRTQMKDLEYLLTTANQEVQ